MEPIHAASVSARSGRVELPCLAIIVECSTRVARFSLGMSFDPTSLLISFVFGSIGFVGFVYGRRMKRFPHMLAGGLLMAYPLVVGDPLVMAVVGLVIVGLWVVAVRMGA